MRRSLTSLFLLALALVSSACIVDARSADRATGTFSRTLEVTGPVQLEIETGAGEISIRAVDSGPMRVEGRVSAGGRRFWNSEDGADRVREIQKAPPIEQAGNDIHIGRWPRWNNVRISYLVTVPRDTSLRLRTGSGDVVIGDLKGPVAAQLGSGNIRVGRVGGDVRVRTGSGDIELQEALGAINVSTGSGDVLVQATGASRAEVTTGSGDVEVEGAGGALRVRTGSGEILVTGTPTAPWDLGTGSGDVSIETTDSAGFNADIRSSSGDIDARAVVATDRNTRHEVRGTVRGGGPLVSASTGAGEVRVR
ncbi:MAG: DUF4097 family beta strand repeat-containing protein [Vicinamibacterales bacterium]